MTRAVRAALHGRFAEALRLNPLGILLLTIGLTALALRVLAWTRKIPHGPKLRPGARCGWILAAAVMIFWVARNLPWWPWPLP